MYESSSSSAGGGNLDGMEATKILRDNVYMSPQLINLTNTLRAGSTTLNGSKRNKMTCQAGGHVGPCSSSSAQSTPAKKSKRAREQQQQHLNDPTLLPEQEVVFRYC